MSLFTSLYGSGAGAPIGSILASTGVINDPDWIRLDNSVYLRADYPDLDVTNKLTFHGSSLVTGPTVGAQNWNVIHITGSTWYAHSMDANTNARKSTDNGATWTSCTIPANGLSWHVQYVNGLYFCTYYASGTTATYYTSTDGITWTTLTWPRSDHCFAGIGYIDGRYVAVATYSSGAPTRSLWSTDAINWTQVTAFSTGANGQTYFGGKLFKRMTYCRKLGLVFSTLSYGPYFLHTRDGLSWGLSASHTPWQGTSMGAIYVSDTFAAEDTDGNLLTGPFQIHGTDQFSSARYENAIDFAPFARTNINAGGPSLSEDFGATFHRAITGMPGRNQVDFSGSRLLSIDASGVVRWIDVDTTRFRAVPPRQFIGPKNPTNLYIKAR